MIEKPLIVNDAIEHTRYKAPGIPCDCAACSTVAAEEDAAREMNHSAWRTLHALRMTMEAGEIRSLAEAYGLIYALELTYEAMAR